MARRTDGEKIDELEKVVSAIRERLEVAGLELAERRGDTADLAKTIAEMKTTIAVVQRDVEDIRRQQMEMKKEQEETNKKRWSLLPPIIGTVVSGIISAVVAYFIARR